MSHMDSPERKDWQKAQNAATRALLETVPLYPQPDGSHGIKVERGGPAPKTPEKVERVARAICSADGGRDSGDPDGTDLWDPSQVIANPNLRIWMAYEDQARAAIEALRIPTDAQLQAFYDATGRPFEIHVWEAMIDAALKEPDPA